MSEVLEKEQVSQGVVRRQVDKLRPMKSEERVAEPYKIEPEPVFVHKEITPEIKNSVIRRSRIIIQTKRLLVVAGVLIISAIIIYPFFKEEKEGVRFSLTGEEQTTEKKGEELVQHIQKPKIYGVDKLNQRYNISADEAVQSGVNSTSMTKISGDVYLKDGGWVNILADSGDYNSETKILKLNGNVQIYGDNGYEMHADRAVVKMDISEAEGYDNIHFQGPLGIIDSQIFKIRKGGDVIEFSGGVHVTAYPEATAAGER